MLVLFLQVLQVQIQILEVRVDLQHEARDVEVEHPLGPLDAPCERRPLERACSAALCTPSAPAMPPANAGLVSVPAVQHAKAEVRAHMSYTHTLFCFTRSQTRCAPGAPANPGTRGPGNIG